jgi:hypothetical protein
VSKKKRKPSVADFALIRAQGATAAAERSVAYAQVERRHLQQRIDELTSLNQSMLAMGAFEKASAGTPAALRAQFNAGYQAGVEASRAPSRVSEWKEKRRHVKEFKRNWKRAHKD